MGDQGDGGSDQRKRHWLRLVIFTLIFVITPLGLYFIVYVEGRLQQTTIRNFNALDGAAEYLTLLVDNLPKVVSNIPLGEPDRTANALNGSTDTPQATDELSKVLKQWGALPVASTSTTSCTEQDSAAFEAITDIAGIYLEDLRSLDSFDEVQLALLRRSGVSLESRSGCAANVAEQVEALAAGNCATADGITKRLVGSARGVRIQVEDCRSLEARSPAVYRALQEPSEVAGTPPRTTEIQVLLDRFGVRLTLPLADLTDAIADNVAPVFDQFLIADRQGNVLYAAAADSAARQPAVTGAPTSREAPIDFVSHVDVRALVLPDVRRRESAQEAAWRRVGAITDPATQGQEFATFGLHSRVERFRVGDIGFEAFIHPFAVYGLDNDLLTASAEETNLPEPIFMIGIVSADRLSAESLRLPLALVADSLLLLGVLFSTSAFLWLWTSGDRLMLGRVHAALLILSALTTAVLYTLFSMQLITRSIDARALDQSVRAVHSSVRKDFADELHRHLEALAKASDAMLEAGEAAARNPSIGQIPSDRVDRVKRRYFCRPPLAAHDPPLTAHAGEHPWPGPQTDRRFPLFDLAFLLDEQGTQWQCLSYRRFDTPPLNLAFRDYFQRPATGALWEVDAMAGGRHGAEASDGAYRADGPERPPGFFLDRITSVLDGTTETVLSARPDALCALTVDEQGQAPEDSTCPAAELPVDAAVFIGRMHALEEAITPPHVRLAVVETATGRTLFHSVGGRSLATNFYRETGGDETLMALVQSGTAGFVPLDYDGNQVRAFVSPLYSDVPWTLITYRGHELEDTLGITAVSLTTLILLVQSGGVVLLSPLLALLLWCIHRHRRAKALPRVTWVARLSGAWVRLLVAAVITALALILTAWLAPRALPLLVSLIGALFAILVVCLPGKRARRHTVDPLSKEEEHSGNAFAPVIAFAMFVLLVGVFPAVGGMLHFRAMLSYDLADYLRNNLAASVVAKCERHAVHAQRYKDPHDTPPMTPSGERVRWQGVFDHGWHLTTDGQDSSSPTALPPPCQTFADAGERLNAVDTALGFDGPGEPEQASSGQLRLRSLTYEPYQRVAAFSPLASELLAQRGDLSIRKHYRAPGEVLRTIAPPLDQLSWLEHVATLKVIQFLLVVGFGVFLTTLVVLSVVHRLLGATERLPILSGVAPDYVPTSWRMDLSHPVQACVVHRSLALCRIFLQHVAGHFGEIQTARWNATTGLFDLEAYDLSTPHCYAGLAHKLTNAGDRNKAKTRETTTPEAVRTRKLLVIEHFERHLLNEKARRALVLVLERRVAEGGSVLIFSQILPGYWLTRAGQEIQLSNGKQAESSETAMRWSSLMSAMDVRLLKVDRERLIDAFKMTILADCKESDREKKASELEKSPVYRAMCIEALANPALLELAAGIARHTLAQEREDDGRQREHESARGDDFARARLAEERFGVRAAGHFHKLWSASTLEERLQLLALARGGYADPTQSALLSSLANRGLVTTQGPIQLCSPAFGRFIATQLIHNTLLDWRHAGGGKVWNAIWPPLLVLILLAAAFFVSSTPEALAPLAAVLAAGIGAMPVIGSLLNNFSQLRKAGRAE